ncbi:MAG: fasciclin domain-containing protein, partial [Poseidonia sp.]
TDTPNDIPRTAQCTGVHDSLVAAVIQAELLETLQGEGPFTLFAPTDQAFADAGIDLAALDTAEGKAQLTDILLSHVVAGAVPAANVSNCMTAATVSGHSLSFSAGDTVMVNGATVTTADVMTSNGIIHVIDTVLSPTDAYNDIAATAGCTGVHTSLVAALVQAELVETLQGEGPYTVFAPTDEAFAAAGIDLAALDTEEGKEALTDILLFHVYAGTLASSDITDGKKLRMVNGDDVVFTPGMIEGANITTVDVQTSNGVIHVIDAVLTPPAEGTDSGAGTSGTSDGESSDWILYAGIALVIAGVVGLVVVRLIRKPTEGLESIQALGKTDVASTQFAATAATTAMPDMTAQPAAAQPAYQQQAAQQTYQQQAYQQQAYQATTAQPAAAQLIDDSALSAFYEPEPAAQTQPAQAVAQPAQAAVAQPAAVVEPVAQAQPAQAVALPAAEPAVAQPAAQPAVVEQPAAPVAEPTVVNQWTDETGHTWRIMSDGSHRWWNGSDWQMV